MTYAAPRFFVAVLAALACAGDDAGLASSSDSSQQSDPVVRASGVAFSLILEKTSFTIGEPVRFAFRVENESEEVVSFSSSSACQAYFDVEQNDGAVFHLRFQRLCAAALTKLEIAPGERVDFPFSWNQVDDAGAAVARGVYQLVGFLADENSPKVSASVRLE